MQKFAQIKEQIVAGLKVDNKHTDLDRIFFIDILTRLFLLQACYK